MNYYRNDTQSIKMIERWIMICFFGFNIYLIMFSEILLDYNTQERVNEY